MRTLLFILILTSFIARSQEINRYIFASGMERNIWNASIFNKDNLIYFNYSTDENYFLYQLARETIESYGMNYANPNESNEYIDGDITLNVIIYENISFGSNSNYDMTYENDKAKIIISFSEKGSYIFLYKK
jgi:hypothetical protein